MRIALVDDEPRMAEIIAMVLRRDGHDVTTWNQPGTFLDALAASVPGGDGPEVLLTDLRMPGVDGLGVLTRARALDPDLPVIVFTGHGSVETAVEAMRSGAWDFLEKPVDNERCRAAVRRACSYARATAENRRLRANLVDGLPAVVADSPAMRRVLDLVGRAARAASPVLLTGESGTGKEVIARRLHHLSPRVGGPFVAVNCAAFSAGVLESELFGHEKGAYTGADRARAGVFERAHGGTLFLDEIGDIHPDFQAKLLRVVQEGEVLRVGADRPRKVDVRLVTATLRDLRADVAGGRFREDLWFRLAVLPIHLPPLRDRPEDVLPLARHFLHRLSGGTPKSLAPEVEAWLAAHDWPGNVRELSNLLERGAVMADGPEITLDALLLPAVTAAGPAADPGDETLAAFLDRQAADHVRAVLRASGGARQEAARRLGVDRTTLFRTMKRLGLD